MLGIWWRGLTARALRLVVDWAFAEFDLVRVGLYCDVENVASQRVAETAQDLDAAGQPILARYHSTSGGRTMDNEDAFDTRTIPVDDSEGTNSNLHAKETRLSLDIRGDGGYVICPDYHGAGTPDELNEVDGR